MKKLITLFIALFLASSFLEAQQLPLYNIYRDHWNILNPAAVSNNYLINEWEQSIGVSYRHQWLGIEGAPATGVANWEWVRDDLNSVFGGHIINDRTGEISQTGVYGQYAYKIEFGGRADQSVTIGLSAGLVQYRANLSEIQFFDAQEESVTDDNLLHPDFGLGVFYHFEDRYYAGISMPQIIGLNTRFVTPDRDFNIDRVQHLYAVVGGYFQVTWFGNETSFVEPSMWVKYAPNAPLNIDLNARYQISELIWVGTGVGTGFGIDQSLAMHFETGLILGEQSNIMNGQFKVGMGFDLPISGGYGADFKSAIEINMIYSFGGY